MPHIPQGTTDTLTLELFDPALESALRPSPDYDVSRWLYVPNTDRKSTRLNSSH